MSTSMTFMYDAFLFADSNETKRYNLAKFFAANARPVYDTLYASLHLASPSNDLENFDFETARNAQRIITFAFQEAAREHSRSWTSRSFCVASIGLLAGAISVMHQDPQTSVILGSAAAASGLVTNTIERALSPLQQIIREYGIDPYAPDDRKVYETAQRKLDMLMALTQQKTAVLMRCKARLSQIAEYPGASGTTSKPINVPAL